MRRAILIVILLTVFPLLAGGCDLLDSTEAGPKTVDTPVRPTPASTPNTDTTPESAATALPAPTTLTITVWTTPDLAPQPELAGGPALAEQLLRFDNDHADLRLVVESKTVGGQGGTLSYLRTGRTVAPSILPDLILLPDGQLAEAASQELIYPLDNLLPAELFDDLYPAARDLARIDGQYYAYPFALTNLRHLVYNPAVITGTLPSTWPTLLAQPDPPSFVLPAAGPAGAAFTLHYYLAAGGTLVNDAGQPALQVEPLAAALTQIQQGLTANLIDSQSGTTTSVEQAWQIFANSSTAIAGTEAGYFLRQQSAASGGYAFAPLPGPEGPLSPLVNGLTWAISTPEPNRQALAAELITWLTDSQNLGEWSRQSYRLPARASALATWPATDGYVTFLEERLEAARPFPAAANAALLLALSEATTDVLLQVSTPQVAAEEAAAALSPDA